MKHTPKTPASPHDDYLGPWNLHRCDPRHPIIANVSAKPVTFVRTSYRSPLHGHDRLQLWGTIGPDEEFNLCMCDEPEAFPIEVTLSWFDAHSIFEQSWSFDAVCSEHGEPGAGPC